MEAIKALDQKDTWYWISYLCSAISAICKCKLERLWYGEKERQVRKNFEPYQRVLQRYRRPRDSNSLLILILTPDILNYWKIVCRIMSLVNTLQLKEKISKHFTIEKIPRFQCHLAALLRNMSTILKPTKRLEASSSSICVWNAGAAVQ